MSGALYPKLLGDIGGTNVRLALQAQSDGRIEHIQVMPLAEHAGMAEAITAYLQAHGAHEGAMRPRSGALGVAAPVTGDVVKMFNASWHFSIQALQQALGLQSLRVLNDFTVLALSLPALGPQDVRQIGGRAPVAGMTKALIGPGTGLGMSGLLPGEGADGQTVWVPIAGEGGHITLTVSTPDEVALLQTLWRRYPHVSAERVLSGAGLVELYEAHAEMAGLCIEPRTPADVTAKGLSGECPACEAALRSFCQLLGTVASNLAVTLGAFGGLYIGGGIVPRLGCFFDRSGFRARFDAKGRYSDYLAAIPVFVIETPYPALIGASRA